MCAPQKYRQQNDLPKGIFRLIGLKKDYWQQVERLLRSSHCFDFFSKPAHLNPGITQKSTK